MVYGSLAFYGFLGGVFPFVSPFLFLSVSFFPVVWASRARHKAVGRSATGVGLGSRGGAVISLTNIQDSNQTSNQFPVYGKSVS